MLSVVIPTVQKKLKVLETLLSQLCEDVSIDEILVINNKPELPLEFDDDKIWVFAPEENLYVNSSWNLGIAKIKNENFVLMNDDCLICKDMCKKVVESKIFNDPNTGLIGVSPASIHQYVNVDYISIPECDDSVEPKFIPMNRYLGTGDWGIAIFGKKSNFYTIPDDLKIIYGDNYLLYQNHQNYKQNYSLSNIPFNHIHSSSRASPEFSHIISQDIFNSKKYFTKPGDDGISNKQYDYEIDYRGNVCIISLIYKKEKSYIFLRYRDDNGVYLDESLKKHILLLAPSIHKKLIPKLISDIKSGQNKSC